jgi:acetyltransferase-like isoleucine patch superfamily enzyme
MEGAELSRITSDVILGKDVKILSLVNLYGCTIGDRTKIGSFVEIQKNAVIGSDCKISSHSFICEGVHIADKVFVGHGVTFINDLYPEAVREDGTMQTDADWEVVPTYVEKGASIGSNSTILCGITIGQSSIIGAGSVVTKDVPSNQIWAGNPARFLRQV